MKRLTVLLFLTIFSVQTHAQRGGQGQNVQRVQAAKISYITDRLALTPEQAQRFWPVYRSYQAEQRAVRREHIAGLRRRQAGVAAEPDEKASRQALESSLEMQEEQLSLKRKYKDEFLRVISAQQLVQLYQAEQDFNRLLLQRVRDARGKTPRQKVYFAPED